MTPVWLAFVSGALVGGAVAIAVLGIALHWADIISRRKPQPSKFAGTLHRIEERRLAVPTVKRRQRIPVVGVER